MICNTQIYKITTVTIKIYTTLSVHKILTQITVPLYTNPLIWGIYSLCLCPQHPYLLIQTSTLLHYRLFCIMVDVVESRCLLFLPAVFQFWVALDSLSSSILLTWPYHLRPLFWISSIIVCSAPISFLIWLFLILSRLDLLVAP